LFSELDKLENKSKRRDQMAQRQLKAISDPTRYKIIRQLSLRPHYVQELADRLKLTAATLSHHLDHLLQVRLVGVIIEGRRSYYNLNADELTELSKTLKHMAERSRLEE
jgi:DNA-binding transcriptional ArsR family regulator